MASRLLPMEEYPYWQGIQIALRVFPGPGGLLQQDLQLGAVSIEDCDGVRLLGWQRQCRRKVQRKLFSQPVFGQIRGYVCLHLGLGLGLKYCDRFEVGDGS